MVVVVVKVRVERKKIEKPSHVAVFEEGVEVSRLQASDQPHSTKSLLQVYNLLMSFTLLFPNIQILKLRSVSASL